MNRIDDEIKARLKRIAEKKFKTTMIFPLGKFEQTFGELWGHGLEEHELDTEQQKMRAKWDAVRRDILDNGNHQCRCFKQELDLHMFAYEGYKYRFEPRNSKELTNHE